MKRLYAFGSLCLLAGVSVATPLPKFNSGEKVLCLVQKDDQGIQGIRICVEVGRKAAFTFTWCGQMKGGAWGSPFGNIPAGTKITADWDAATKTATLVKPYLCGKEVRTFTVRVKVPEEGLAEVDWSGNPDQAFCSASFLGYEQYGLLLDDVEYVQPPFLDVLAKAAKVTSARKIKIAADYPEQSVAVSLPNFGWGGFEERGIDDRWGRRRMLCLYASQPSACRLTIDFRTPKKVSPYPVVRGIDFGALDDLHVPLTPTRNLLPNPSFEGGLRYYKTNIHGCHAYFPTNDEAVACVEGGLFGKYALRIRDVPYNRYVESMPLSLEEGKTYTLSFYGKSTTEKPVKFRLGIATADKKAAKTVYHGQEYFYGDMRSNDSSFVLSNEWRRYSRVFNGSVKGFRFVMSRKDVLLDGFQLEEGDGATEYVDAPAYGRLVTADRENVIEAKGLHDAAMYFSGRPNMVVGAHFSLEDVRRVSVWSEDAEIRFNEEGQACHKMGWKILPKGVFVLKVDYVAQTAKWTDYFRLAIIDSLENTHPTASVFSLLPYFDHSFGDRVAALYRRFGFGALTHGSGWFTDQISGGLEVKLPGLDLLRKNRIATTMAIAFKAKEAGCTDPRDWKVVTPEIEKKIEDYCYRYSEGLPPDVFSCVAFFGEDELFYLPAHGLYEEYFKAQAAAIRGCQRRYPSLRGAPTQGTFSYSPDSSSGKAISNYMRVSKEKGYKYDVIGIHCYGATDKPNKKDLDADLDYLRSDMLKFGYGRETHINVSETGNISMTYIPEWGCTGWGDYYGEGKPSYAWGRSELDVSAEYLRMYLVGLKYYPQLESLNTWAHPVYDDLVFTPYAFAAGVNALGNLLPDCRFLKNVRPTGMMRGFAFDRPRTKDGLVAIWSVDPGHANGSKPPAHLLVRTPVGAQAFDWAGNSFVPQRTAEGLDDFEIGQFPMYVAATDTRTLADAFIAAESDDISVNLGVTCVPTLAGTVEFRLKNRISRALDGAIVCDGKTLPFSVNIGKEISLVAPNVSGESATGRVYFWNRGFKLVPKRGDAVFKSWSMDYFYVPYCVNKPDWVKVPALVASNRMTGSAVEDMTVRYQLAWNEDALYLRVCVRDTQRLLFPEVWQKQGAESCLHTHDGALEVYFDTFTDARSAVAPAIDDNDYRYDFTGPKDGASGKGFAWRLFGVNQQYADGLNYPKPEEAAAKVLCDFEVVQDGYVYTITFPQRYLLPFELVSGAITGFGLQCHDRDPDPSDKKKCLFGSVGNATREGAGCNNNPHLWPLMILKR